MGIDDVIVESARAVFIDRDGVINRAPVRQGKPYPPASVEALEIIEGTAEALQRLHDAGFRLIVVTNQPDVARGTTPRSIVEAIHDRMRATLPIDEYLTCYHDGDACECRKPRPGALLDAARRHRLDLKRSFLVGDRWKDIEAGQRGGCKCYFIDYGYAERQPSGDYVRVRSLIEAVGLILQSDRKTDEDG